MAVLVIPDEEYGPAMRRCTPLQRNFVIAYLTFGYGSNVKLAKAAGCQGDDDTLRVSGYRLMHNERVLAAIEEEAKKRLKSGGVMAVSRLLELANGAKEEKDQLTAIKMVLNRVGMHEKTEHQVNVQHEHKTDSETLDRITFLANRLGLDPQKLLGSSAPAGTVIEGEFTEVPAEEPAATEEDPQW